MMASDTHPRDAEAAEYVVGTLPWAEREAFEREVERDPALAALVRDWEERLAPLAAHVPPVAPPASSWRALSARIGAERPGGFGTIVAWPEPADILRLRRSRAVWRGATAALGSLAAALVLFIAADRLKPIVPIPGLVAVVNRSGELPALIVRVDPRAGMVQVRELAAETPADRSLELWSIVGAGPPRSLGVLAAGQRVTVPEGDRSRLLGATIAVSVEPRGGSPTGGPTGPVVYQGKLVSEAP